MSHAAPFAAGLGLSSLRGATLAQVDAAAALQHRTDRKYLLPLDGARLLVDRLAGSHHVLDLAGRRTTSYRSTYFDTERLGAWRAHVQGRRRRWKVRTRLYAEDGLCRVEVKTKDGRGATVKHALRASAGVYGHLGEHAADFVDGVLRRAGIPVTAGALSPAAEIRYVRAALADLDHGTRVTLDGGLTCHHMDRTAALDPGHVLVETKGGTRPAPADRLLLRLGARPVSLSKYVVGQSLLTPGLPDNDVRRLARRYFTAGPRPAPLLERTPAA
ncbi:polyphosphate polymerase domain-containing protein [Streptomyces tropicalis]|uniref:Polyphosphate polymerase domain-containing protein n=1 Tax=Streptomyces tropicalis TaxID=3034234 RepID=A0ABT6AB52_9ACTN|nr:polyphosphate polymerase domain-containing protein [Streptomyces tropicalis]MDF3301871.1 polyphosphate polymerase domain-containing protein [Streptomyces tropicalis]